MGIDVKDFRLALINEYAYLVHEDADDVCDVDERTPKEYADYITEATYEQCLEEVAFSDEEDLQKYIDCWKDQSQYY